MDAKDACTNQHSERVADLAHRLAVAALWSPADAERMRAAGLVHDIGKLAVPAAILQKPGRLTREEYEIVQAHALLGAEMLRHSGYLDAEQVEWVRHHHERVDGRGYPDGLRRGELSEGAVLLCLADSWDVMVSPRPYKDAKPMAEALREVRDLCGQQFHHLAVRALERDLGEPPD